MYMCMYNVCVYVYGTRINWISSGSLSKKSSRIGVYVYVYVYIYIVYVRAICICTHQLNLIIHTHIHTHTHTVFISSWSLSWLWELPRSLPTSSDTILMLESSVGCGGPEHRVALYVCMYVCMYMCVHACACMRDNWCRYVSACVCMNMYVYVNALPQRAYTMSAFRECMWHVWSVCK